MAPVELVVEARPAGKALGDDDSVFDLFDLFNTQEEEEDAAAEEAQTDSTSSEGEPDLIVPSVSVRDTTLTPGQAFILNATVQNQGDGQAAATTLRYYRSNDATITSSDTEVGTDAIGALNASATSAVLIWLTAPTRTYFYGACVESVSGESDTDNNCSQAVRITVGSGDGEDGHTTREEATDDAEEEVAGDTPVSIPDANLRATIAAALGKTSGAPISVGDMALLTEGLDAQGVGISDLTGLEFVTNLETLWLNNNRITDVSVLSGLTNLRDLGLNGNNLTDVSVLSGLTNLKFLGLSSNRITDVSVLSGLTNLKFLGLNNNRVADVSVLSGLTNLEFLWLSSNRVADVSVLSGLTNLRDLRLNGNNLTDVSVLSGLTNLEFLELNGNRVADVSAFSGLTKLRELKLGVNNITDVSALRNLAHLTMLDLRGNPLNVSLHQ